MPSVNLHDALFMYRDNIAQEVSVRLLLRQILLELTVVSQERFQKSDLFTPHL